MNNPTELCLIRIRKNGLVVGAGMIVDESHAITCAHVIDDFIVDKNESSISDIQIQFDIPFIAPNLFYSASIEQWISPDPKREWDQDVAILKLPPNLPKEIKPAPLIWNKDIRRHQVKSIGFIERREEGVIVEGTIIDKIPPGLYQMAENPIGFVVDKGFSGSPVWDNSAGGVIGIIVRHESLLDYRAAFILPVEAIIDIWPPLSEFDTIKYRPTKSLSEIINTLFRKSSDRYTLIKWVTANVIGWPIGLFLAYESILSPYCYCCLALFIPLIIFYSIQKKYDRSSLYSVIGTIILLLISFLALGFGQPLVWIGLCVGFAQWFAIKDLIKKDELWVFATIAGWVLGMIPIVLYYGGKLLTKLGEPGFRIYTSNTYDLQSLREFLGTPIINIILGVFCVSVLFSSIAQFLILRKNFKKAGWWIASNFLSGICVVVLLSPLILKTKELIMKSSDVSLQHNEIQSSLELLSVGMLFIIFFLLGPIFGVINGLTLTRMAKGSIEGNYPQ